MHKNFWLALSASNIYFFFPLNIAGEKKKNLDCVPEQYTFPSVQRFIVIEIQDWCSVNDVWYEMGMYLLMVHNTVKATKNPFFFSASLTQMKSVQSELNIG